MARAIRCILPTQRSSSMLIRGAIAVAAPPESADARILDTLVACIVRCVCRRKFLSSTSKGAKEISGKRPHRDTSSCIPRAIGIDSLKIVGLGISLLGCDTSRFSNLDRKLLTCPVEGRWVVSSPRHAEPSATSALLTIPIGNSLADYNKSAGRHQM